MQARSLVEFSKYVGEMEREFNNLNREDPIAPPACMLEIVELVNRWCVIRLALLQQQQPPDDEPSVPVLPVDQLTLPPDGSLIPVDRECLVVYADKGDVSFRWVDLRRPSGNRVRETQINVTRLTRNPEDGYRLLVHAVRTLASRSGEI